MHLENVNPRSGFSDGKDKDIIEDPRSGYTNITITKDNSGYCNIYNTRYNNKNEHNESDEHKKNVNKKNLLMGIGEIKLMSWD